MPSARRSGRLKGPRAAYTEDPFETAGISDDSSSGKAVRAPKGKGKRRQEDESTSDEEFVAPGSDEEMNDKVDDDKVSEEVAEESADDGDAMEVDEPEFAPNRKGTVVRPLSMKKRHTDSAVAASPEETHYRGILDPKDHVAKPMHYALTFGSDSRDLASAIYLRDRWFRGIDACLPTRFSLEHILDEPTYEYGPTLGIHPDDIKRERTSGWDWYYDTETGEKFRKRQCTAKIKDADARRNYFPKPKKGKHTICMGPADKQQTIHLGCHESFNYGELWKESKARKSDQAAETTVREGWLMSFGQKVQCMAWAPNQDGLPQYLAVSVPISNEQKKKWQPPGSEPFSAFQPTPPYPCALQLWEIIGKTAGAQTNTLDMDTKPRLRLALCSEWGDLRRMAWCPMGRETRDEDDEGDSRPIGLLAGIWGDGKLRVLDVRIRRGSEKAEYVKVNSPVFEARPPSTLCTCLAWLSPSDIAVGCSNGFVAVWSILPSTTPEPQPYFYQPIHTSYVLGVTSAYPTNPHLLSTISMDGETRLWSMIDPQSEMASTPRMRMASSHISYAPMLFSVFSTDENNFGRMMPVRRFFASSTVGGIPSTVSALAPCSLWHPSIMYGGTGGEVMATNPFRRLLYTKEQQWQQLWFTHDWVQGPETNSPGISRFYDGYQAESQSLAKNLTGQKRPVMGLSLATIHDENTHVTALGWNPNRSCAAWASAALGCGLVRVEDLAI